jgi:hypothetical protein
MAVPRLLRSPGDPGGNAPERLLCIRRIATPFSSCAKLYPRDAERKPVDISIWLPCIDGRPKAPVAVLRGVIGVIGDGLASKSSSWKPASWTRSIFGLTL